MRSEDQIKRMMIQMKQMESRLEAAGQQDELAVVRGKIEMLEWVLDAPAGKYNR